MKLASETKHEAISWPCPGLDQKTQIKKGGMIASRYVLVALQLGKEIAMFGLAALGRFRAKLGPGTRSNGSSSKIA